MTISVINHMNIRGSRSTFRMEAEVDLSGIVTLYINYLQSAIVQADNVRKYNVRSVRKPNCEGAGISVYWVQRNTRSYRMNSEKKSIGNIIDLVFKGVALAMAVAVIVTSILGVMDAQGQTILLGIGLFGLAITALDKE